MHGLTIDEILQVLNYYSEDPTNLWLKESEKQYLITYSYSGCGVWDESVPRKELDKLLDDKSKQYELSSGNIRREYIDSLIHKALTVEAYVKVSIKLTSFLIVQQFVGKKK